MRQRSAAAILVLLLVGATLAVGAGTASAAVSFSQGTLTIDGTSGNDTIQVDCGAGKVIVPDATTTDCDKVKHIVINAGGGDDDVTLSLMFPGDFPLLVDVSTHGGPGYDDLTGWPGRDLVFGEGLADDFFTSGGNDVFDGGAAWDRVNASCNCDMTFASGALELSGAVGKSKLSLIEGLHLIGGGGPNTIDMSAWSGAANIIGSAGSDTLTGGTGRDDIFPGNGTDTVDAGKGDDIITVEETVNSPDDLTGGPGSDLLYGGTLSASSVLNNTQLTGYGTDTIDTFERAKLQRATAGTVNASGFSGPVELIGSSGADTLSGGSGDDLISGWGGADNLDGNGGTDEVEGSTTTGSTLTSFSMTSSAGNDTLDSFEKAFISGGSSGGGLYNVAGFPGPVTISDGGGDDTVLGNGQTTVSFGVLDVPILGDDSSITGIGRTVDLADVSKIILSMGGSGDVDLTGFTGRSVVYGELGNDTIETGPGADFVSGGPGNDDVSGGAGKDRLYGQKGNDVLDGQAGRDSCNADPGNDTLKSCEVAIKPLPEK